MSTKNNNDDEVLTLDEACEVMKLDQRVISRALKRGTLPAGKPSNSAGWRMTRRALLDWVDAGMPGSEPTHDDDTDEKAVKDAGG